MISSHNFKYKIKEHLKINILLIVVYIIGSIYLIQKDLNFKSAKYVLEVRNNLKLSETQKGYSSIYLEGLAVKYAEDDNNLLSERMRLIQPLGNTLNQNDIIKEIFSLLLDKEEFYILLKKDKNLSRLIKQNTLAMYPLYKEKGISLYDAFNTKVISVSSERGVLTFIGKGEIEVMEMTYSYANYYAFLFSNYLKSNYEIVFDPNSNFNKLGKDIFYHVPLNELKSRSIYFSSFSYYVILTIIYFIFLVVCNYIYSFRNITKENKKT